MTQETLAVKVMPTKANMHCGKVEVRKEDVRSVQVTGGKVKVLNGFSFEAKLLTAPMTATTLADMKKRTCTYKSIFFIKQGDMLENYITQTLANVILSLISCKIL